MANFRRKLLMIYNEIHNESRVEGSGNVGWGMEVWGGVWEYMLWGMGVYGRSRGSTGWEYYGRSRGSTGWEYYGRSVGVWDRRQWIC